MEQPDWLRTPPSPDAEQFRDPSFTIRAIFDIFDAGSKTNGYRLFDVPSARDDLVSSLTAGWLAKLNGVVPQATLKERVRAAPLVYVTLPIASSLVRHANHTPASFTLEEATRRLSVPLALCFFERPLTFRSHNTAATLSVNAIMWVRYDGGLVVVLLQQGWRNEWWLCRGAGIWHNDDPRETGCVIQWKSPEGDADLTQLEVGPVIRRILAALWAIAAEPRAADVRDRPASRAAARAAQRAGREPELIKVIDMRAPVATKRNTDGPGFSVEWSHRWEVNAHLKLQPCGPGNQDRELILVPAHIKGPADKPLVRKETIRVIR